ncbi:hypothetical protein [Zoogloea sp. LCSB751]|uniref:hypothetical protein n=1 Tax=Zoogloea sp. LCSB751 TaxID=1965277 RepID=UPI0009A491A5|nr:hypothetical protein [Zoogloea sp. LCSB751]
MSLLRPTVLLASLLAATAACAEPATLHWPVPMPSGPAWRIVDLREGKGVRHEEYLPRGQGLEDYRDRILVQRFAAQDMGPDTYLAYIAAGLARHCTGFTTSGLVSATRDGLSSATRTAYCGNFENRPYGYVIAQKAIRDGDHLFVVEREWRLPAFAIDDTGMASLSFGMPAEDEALKREIHVATRWLLEQVQPGRIAPAPVQNTAAPAPSPKTPPRPAKRR